MRRIAYILLIIGLVACSGSKKDSKEEITVFAAASLTDVVTQIAHHFEKEHGISIKLNVAASGTLARQIEQGADADVYLSANKNWVDFLVEKGKTVETAVFAQNDLVLVSPLNVDSQFLKVDSLLMYSKSKIAIGDPGFVPAGKYAMQVFDYYELNFAKRLLQSQNVRSALMMVELGEADFGVIYKTDALHSKKVKVVYTFPKESHQPVEYYCALISENVLAKQFYDYLYLPKTRRVLTDYSFIAD